MATEITPAPGMEGCVMCRHLRAKEMFYNAALDDEDRFRNSIFWCLRTQEVFGPDGRRVHRTECSPGRSCFME
jgi:hypothetical protein